MLDEFLRSGTGRADCRRTGNGSGGIQFRKDQGCKMKQKYTITVADMELNINANVTFQRNKLLSLSGMYEGEYISAAQYTALAGLNGAGLHGGYNNIVYQIVGQPLGVFYLPHCEGLVSDGNGGYTYKIADLNGGGVNLEEGEDRYVAGQGRTGYSQDLVRFQHQLPLQAF